MSAQKLPLKIAGIPLFAEPLLDFFQKWKTPGELESFSVTRKVMAIAEQKADCKDVRIGPENANEMESPGN